ncbi:MAG: hypothetical protein Q4G61_09835 [Tissierellia bacterium]|nr:hypothetical protein [Tissierellia bacterium]
MKLPDPVIEIIREIENNDFEAYLVGKTVYECLEGESTDSYSLISNAPISFFLNSIIEWKLIEEDMLQYITPPHDNSTIISVKIFHDSLEQYFHTCSYTFEAIAMTKDGILFDDESGLNDCKYHVLRTISDPNSIIVKDPTIVMTSLLYATKYDLRYHPSLTRAIADNSNLIQEIPPEVILHYFQNMLACSNPGWGVEILIKNNLLSLVIGKSIDISIKENEEIALDLYCKNIHKTKPIIRNRLCAFYLCFVNNRDLEVINHLPYDTSLLSTYKYIRENLSTILSKHSRYSLKRFIYNQGSNNYRLLDDMNKIICKVFDVGCSEAYKRQEMLCDIINKGEAIFLDDLQITSQDLIETAVVTTVEDTASILESILKHIHFFPMKNEKSYLLKIAKKARAKKAVITKIQKILSNG